jgi:hypothetical protein
MTLPFIANSLNSDAKLIGRLPFYLLMAAAARRGRTGWLASLAKSALRAQTNGPPQKAARTVS